MAKQTKNRRVAPASRAALKPTFKASVQAGGVLELLVYEDIGFDWWTGEGVTAKTVKQSIDEAGVFNSISVRINSPGGDAFEGVAIYNLLRAQKKPVNVFVDGLAASAASIIAMAGDTITMGNNAMMMIHNAWSGCQGYASDMRKMADLLDKVSAAVAQTYIDRAGLTADDVKALMDAESWLSALECLEKNLATSIAQNDENDDAAMALAKSFKALKRLNKVPDALRNDDMEDDAACTCTCDPCMQGDCAGCNCTGCDSDTCGAEACDCGSSPDDAAAAEIELMEAELQLLGLRGKR